MGVTIQMLLDTKRGYRDTNVNHVYPEWRAILYFDDILYRACTLAI